MYVVKALWNNVAFYVHFNICSSYENIIFKKLFSNFHWSISHAWVIQGNTLWPLLLAQFWPKFRIFVEKYPLLHQLVNHQHKFNYFKIILDMFTKVSANILYIYIIKKLSMLFTVYFRYHSTCMNMLLWLNSLSYCALFCINVIHMKISYR